MDDQGGGKGDRYYGEGSDSHVSTGDTSSEPLSCEDLRFSTVLLSPVPSVITKLRADQRLDVVLKPVDGEDTAVAATSPGGEVAGSIGSSYIARLIQCLREKHRYVALILEPPKAGSCYVQIRHESRS